MPNEYGDPLPSELMEPLELGGYEFHRTSYMISNSLVIAVVLLARQGGVKLNPADTERIACKAAEMIGDALLRIPTFP